MSAFLFLMTFVSLTFLVANAMTVIFLVGKPREPITGGVAVIATILNVIIISTIILLVQSAS